MKNRKFKARLKHDALKKYISVKFSKYSKEYTYLCANDEIEVGDVVEAPSDNYPFHNVAFVTKIKFLKESQLHFDKKRLLKIDKIVSKQDRDFIFDNIGFLKNHINDGLLEQWTNVDRDEWATWWYSSFGGTICYEQDGVLSCEYGEWRVENNNVTVDFFYYTITSSNDLNIKIDFCKTILTELFYRQIDEETFKTLAERIH